MGIEKIDEEKVDPFRGVHLRREKHCKESGVKKECFGFVFCSCLFSIGNLDMFRPEESPLSG